MQYKIRALGLSAKTGFYQGLTLVELLVTVVILGLLSIGLTSFLNVQLFESLRYEQATREVDDASRLQHLIDTEVSESDEINYGIALPSQCGSGNSLFSLQIPNDYDVAGQLPKYYQVYYYIANQSVYRCGKPPCPSGNLKFTTGACSDPGLAPGTVVDDVPSLLTANISLERISSGSSPEVLRYRLKGLAGNVLFDGSAYGQAEAIR